MLKYVNYDIVFQEIPDEVILAINLSNCPHRCHGCHSPHLQQNIGEKLDLPLLTSLLYRYGGLITCVCFMGGDSNPNEVCLMAAFIQEKFNGKIKTAWYSGCSSIDSTINIESFNFIKIGPYIEHLGGLDKPTTNQRLYQIEGGRMIDITWKMQRKHRPM